MMPGVKSLVLLISVGLWSGVRLGSKRIFRLQSSKLNWTQAQNHCRDQHLDLASFLDLTQQTDALQILREAKTVGPVWTGLHRPWTWALNQEVVPLGSAWFNPWDAGQPQDGDCVALRTDGTWVTKNCSAKLSYYSCVDKDKDTVLVGNLNWTQAQDQCKSWALDLSSIRDQNQTQAVLNSFYSLRQNMTTTTALILYSSLLQQTTTVSTGPVLIWIGLYRMSWFWPDLSGLSSVFMWTPSDLGPDCVALDQNQNLIQQNCFQELDFICYQDVPVKTVKSVKVRLNPGSANLNDPVVQQSILQQLGQRLEVGGVSGVRLRWRRCQREATGAAPPAACDQQQSKV